MNDIKSILENGYCKLILTCRLQVFKDKMFANLEIFKICECNLRSDGLSLTPKEKETMTAVYFKNHALEALQHLGEYEFLPFLCQLYYVQRNNPHLNLEMFLNDPFSFYKNELPSMYNDCAEGRYKYCALLLLVIFNNNLDDKIVRGKHPKVKEIIEDIIEVCEIEENITGRKLMSQLQILIGTFVTYDEGIFHTIHDKLFDFLAFYFGTQEQIIDILIKHAKDRFVRERLVVTDDNKSSRYAIRISRDKLQMYMKRVFDDLVSSCNVNINIVENKNLKNVNFRTMFIDFMRHLSKHEITDFMEKASANFLNIMFVTRKKDIKDKVADIFQEYKCFGIVLPDDMLQQYINKWFNALIKTYSTETFMKENRLLKYVSFRTALQFYMRQLNIENVASIIQTGSKDFLNTMFVMTENDVILSANKPNERFVIVIPEGMLQHYIGRWFDDLKKHVGKNKFVNDICSVSSIFRLHLEKTWLLDEVINKNRPLTNLAFRIALRHFIRQLTTEQIASLIHTSGDSFLNTIFVMTEDDINDSAENRYEWFGIVIPDNMLQQYIEKIFNGLTNEFWMVKNIDINRAFKNAKGRTALCNYMNQLTKEKIAALIQNAEHIFFNKMFVMTEEDIKDNSKNKYECFGIVIPEDLLQQYIERWFDDLTKTKWVEAVIKENRPLMNVTFRSVLRTYMRQLTTEKIVSIIQTANDDFINKMFVMTEVEIKDNAENRYECLGNVIPFDLLQQYIQRWFEDLTKTYCSDEFLDKNRPLLNLTFHCALRTHMRQLTTEKIASIIQTTHDAFINTMFVMSEDDIKDNAHYQYKCLGIVIPDDLLQQYIQRLFDVLTKNFMIESAIDKNRPLMNVMFRSAVRTYMRQLATDKIVSIINEAKDSFFNTMFFMTEEELKDDVANRHECFGIIIPDDLLQQYIASWFARLTEPNKLDKYSPFKYLTKTSLVEKFMKICRPLNNVRFRTALRTYMRQLNTEKIGYLIQTAKYDFINTMFVMTEDDIKDYGTNRYEYYGIVIPDELLQQYIQRWFDDLTKTDRVEDIIDKNKPLLNVKFRSVIRTYMKQLTKKQIDSLINTAEDSFLNTMFVMTKEEIKDDAANLYECFGIVIPDDLLQQYIARWFERLTETSEFEKQLNEISFFSDTCWVENFMEICRPLNNVRFRIALRTYIRQFNTEKIGYLIQTARYDFINTMFVMTEDDVNENSEKQYECFGIQIPDDLLQQYIERWFKRLNKTSQLKNFIVKNRLLKNVTFCTALCIYMRKLNTEKIADLIRNAKKYFLNTMFVMTEEDIQDNVKNLYECLSIVIPDDLLQQYIAKWLERLTKTSQLEKFIDENRPLRNVTFRTSLCCNMRQLTTEKIVSLIWNAEAEFFNKMFVMTEEDIKDDAKNQYECYGIILPNDLLQQYTEMWFHHLTNTSCVEEFMDTCRPLKNVTFCSTLCNFFRQLNTKTIGSLIQTANNDFINKMFVMTEEDINDTAQNRYECFGIVIPDDLLQQYIEGWFGRLTKTMELEEYINKNRPMKNVTFCTALRNHMKQFNIEKMGALIQTAESDFINKMFVMTADDIKDNTKNRYEYFGCVIPGSLLQKYIERWLNCVAKSDSAIEYMNYTRPLVNVTFRNELRTYLKQLNSEKIWTLILTKGRDFLNTMFVMNEEDINDNAENQYECVGIVIPCDMLNKYIERWLDRTIYMYETDKFSVKEAMAANRPMRNVAYRKALCTYIRRLSTNKIIRSGRSDFLNTMFVMSEGDIIDNARNRHECIGINIPDGLLQHYIERWFNGLTQTDFVEEYMNINRPLTNVRCQTQLRTYIRQLDEIKIETLIQTGSRDFVNIMFVMTKEDIKNNAVDRYECFGIVLPDDLLQQYIERFFDGLTKTDSMKKYIDVNRCFFNGTFRKVLQTYTKQLTRWKIRNLIRTGSLDFVNTMFVMTEGDIKDDDEKRNECFGIVIPVDFLYQYIERWFGGMTKTDSAKQYIDVNRPFMNSKFQANLDSFISGINSERLEFLNRKGHIDYINTRRHFLEKK